MEITIMSTIAGSTGTLSRLCWKVLSVPVYFKILGVSALAGALFGGIIILQTKTSTSRILYQVLEDETLSITRALAAELEEPVVLGDWSRVKQKLEQVLHATHQVRYIVVRDQEEKIVAQAFDKDMHVDSLRLHSKSPRGAIQVLESREGLIFDTALPIPKGNGGSVQVGMSDHRVARELSSLTQSILKGLALCVSLGTGVWSSSLPTS